MQISSFGSPLQLISNNLPLPQTSEVQVKIHFSGVNFYETLFTQGKYPIDHPLPVTVGGELSGEVVEVGKNVVEFKKGDRIFSLAQTGKGTSGSYATYANIDLRYVYHLPDTISYELGAAFPMVFFTAYAMLKKISIPRKAKILIHSGAGGVGNALIQCVKNLYPQVTIISTCSNESKKEFVRAHHVINISKDDLVSRVQRIAPDGLDIIFDSVGQILFDVHLQFLKPVTGILYSYGSCSGPIQDPEAIAKLRIKNATLMSFLIWPLIEDQAMCQEILNEITNMVIQHSLDPRIDKIFSLQSAEQALCYMKERKNIGKVLLAP